MRRILVSVFFGILFVFGLSSSISISQRIPSKTDSSGSSGTAISSTPFNLDTKSKPLPKGNPSSNRRILRSPQKAKIYLATSITSQTFTLNTLTFKTDSVSSSLPIDSNPDGSTASEVFSISSTNQ